MEKSNVLSTRCFAGGIIAALFAALIACCMLATSAYADDLSDTDQSMIPNSEVSVDSYVTGAATRAAMPSIEILGLASVEESGQFIDTSNYYNWEQPKYMLVATEYNQNLSPYLANLATDQKNPDTKAVLNSSRAGGGGGPNASLGESGTDLDVWNLSPKIVVGTGGGDSWYESYGATGVAYSFDNYTGLAQTMKDIASATTAVGGTLRYGNASSATSIAQEYSDYIFGTMGYVASNTSADETKNIVLIEGVSGDATTGYTYSLLASDAGASGTASVNRYLETTSETGIPAFDTIANNYADELKADDADTTAVISSAGLKAAVADGTIDLIMVGGQQGSSGYGDIMDALYNDQLVENTYFVEDNGSNGAQYGVVMNSVENAQNVGRILGMLYPELIDQQSWMAYYYEHFYHINSDSLASVMASALDGVRYAAVTSVDYNKTVSDVLADASNWVVSTTTDANSDGYTDTCDKNTVIYRIQAGVNYYNSYVELSR